MFTSKTCEQAFRLMFVLVFLAGCTPSKPMLPPGPTLLPPPPKLTQPITPQQPLQPVQANLFKFVQTIQVTPDENYSGVIVGFCRINYVPATDKFAVTFEAKLAQPSGGCKESGYAYKEYTIDMQETGKTGVFSCKTEDSGSIMVDNTYYFAVADMSNYGWQVLKLDAANWTKLAETSISLNPKEKYKNSDPLVAFVNGQLDISSQYNITGDWPEGGAATFHKFFTSDLQPLGEKMLDNPPHVCGMSMVYVDDVYYLVTANSYKGDLVVMTYDKDWKYLGGKTLIQKANWSTGLLYDNQRFYLAYIDTSQRTEPGYFPVYENVHLAAFDRDWNLIEDMAVTNYAPATMVAGRPWLIQHANRLYVSYDVDTIDLAHPEKHNSQALVSVYELTKMP